MKIHENNFNFSYLIKDFNCYNKTSIPLTNDIEQVRKIKFSKFCNFFFWFFNLQFAFVLRRLQFEDEKNIHQVFINAMKLENGICKEEIKGFILNLYIVKYKLFFFYFSPDFCKLSKYLCKFQISPSSKKIWYSNYERLKKSNYKRCLLHEKKKEGNMIIF